MIAQTPDQQYCWRCGSANRCAVAEGRDPSRCWCMGADLRGIPLESRDRCLCQACIDHLAPGPSQAQGARS